MQSMRAWLGLLPLYVAASCGFGSSPRPDAHSGSADGPAEVLENDARSDDTSADHTTVEPETCAARGTPDAGRASLPSPCPPPEYATWPMPNSPALPLPNPARFSAGTLTSRDEVTGLTWEHGTSPKLTWHAAIALCDALLLDGYDDWRLPSRIELVSLIDFSQQPTIYSPAFPLGTPADYFWSATLVPHDPTLGYSVYFGAGLTAQGRRDGATAHARCVRGGRPGVLPRLAITEEVATDRNTGLHWQRRIFEVPLAWPQAEHYCAMLSLRGLSGWRLPSAKELQTLLAEDQLGPMIDLAAFPHTPNGRFWTSSIQVTQGTGIYLDMASGQTDETTLSDSLYFRCVR